MSNCDHYGTLDAAIHKESLARDGVCMVRCRACGEILGELNQVVGLYIDSLRRTQADLDKARSAQDDKARPQEMDLYAKVFTAGFAVHHLEWDDAKDNAEAAVRNMREFFGGDE